MNPHHVDPRHIQAIMIQENNGRELYALTPRQLDSLRAFAIRVCEAGNPDMIERLAQRYGL